MKHLLVLSLALCCSGLSAQEVPELSPQLGRSIERSPEGEVAFDKLRTRCEELWRRSCTLSDKEREELAQCDDPSLELEGYYDVLGPGCSWYCGGGLDTLTASSALPSSLGRTFAASNAHDLSYATAWIEGVPGPGIGESLTYHFPPENPRVTRVTVVNGYVRSEKAWKENTRVRKLRMYVDERPVAILDLADSREEQSFQFEPIGHGDRDDWDILRAKPWWSMRFEIMDVYPGEKFDDTAITEIYFDGIDVH